MNEILFNIELTEMFKLKFCTNYEINYSRCSQFSRNKSVTYFNVLARTHTHTHMHTHTHTHTHTHEQPFNCLRGNIFSVLYPVFLLAYSVPVSSSRKFPHTHKVISLQQHDMLYGSMYDIYYFLYYVTFFTPLHFCTPLMYLSPCSLNPNPHTHW